MNKTEWDKVTKYQDIKNALKDKGQVKDISVIPVVIGTTG